MNSGPPPVVAIPELAFLLRCARVDDGSPGAGGDGPAARLDWDEVFRLALLHGLLPLMYARAGPDLHGVPPEVRTRIVQSHEAGRLRSRVQSAELIRLTRLFRGRGIRTIAYKGPTLGALVYGDAALRSSSDLDVMIQEHDIPAAKRLLTDEGFFSQMQELTPAREASFVRNEHHAEFVSEDELTFVDLHWRLAPRRFPFRIEPRRLWANLRPVPLRDDEVETFAPEDQLLFLSVHGGKDWWRKLIWVVDVDRVVRACPDMDWRALQDEARRCHALRLLLLGLALTRALLATPLPPEVSAALEADPGVSRLADTVYAALSGPARGPGFIEESLQMTPRHVEVCDRLPDRVRYVYRSLVTPDRWDWSRFPLPDALVPLYPPLRLVRLGARCVRDVVRRLA